MASTRDTIGVDEDLEEPTYTIVLNGRHYKISTDKIKMLTDVNGLLLTDQDKLGIVHAIEDYRLSLKPQRQSESPHSPISRESANEYVVMHPPNGPPFEDDLDYLEPVEPPCTSITQTENNEVIFKENNQQSSLEEDIRLHHDDPPPLPTRCIVCKRFWIPKRVFKESKRSKCYKTCAWLLVSLGVGLFISSLVYFAVSGTDDLVLLFSKPNK